jgi:hypothetical protein
MPRRSSSTSTATACPITKAPGDGTISVFLNSGAGFPPQAAWTGAQAAAIQSRDGIYRNLGLHFSTQAQRLQNRR